MKDLQEDNLFGSMRERLGRYEEAPSEELWNRIAPKKKGERVWPLFLEPMGVMMIGIALLLNFDGTKDEMTTVKSESIQHIKKENIKKEESIISEAQVIAYSKIIEEKETFISPQSQIPNLNSEIKKDSIEVVSPILNKKDSSSITVPNEVIPPYKKPKSKFQLYLSVTPGLSFQKMSPSGNDDVIVEGFVANSPLSVKRFGFAIDAGFQRDINRYFGYYGGLSFYQQNQELTYQYYNSQAEVTRIGDSFTYEIFRQEHTKTFNYSMTTLGASAGMLVTLKGEKLKHKFGAGLLYTHSLNSSNSYIAYKLSYRNEVKVNDYITWFVEPNFTYSFIAKEKLDEPFTLKPYRAGISMGLLYRFK
jgi:hypothetical protein